MQVSEIYVSYVNNTQVSDIVLIHFKPLFWFLHLMKTSGYQNFLGIFSGIEMEHWLKLGYN